MPDGLREQVEDFLYDEADLLDDRRFQRWLDLFTEDARYYMPVRDNRLDRPGPASDELSTSGNAYFDDTKATLAIRVKRLYTGAAWAETPPSRSRHLISNVRLRRQNGAECDVASNFLVYRTRLETDRDIFVGSRLDTLRLIDGQMRIARRTIILDQAVLDAKNISVFL